MIKVVVFDNGRGGEIIGNYIEDELPVEVIKVIDRNRGAYKNMKAKEVCERIEMNVKEYIGRARVIVLASPDVSLIAKKYLKTKYPNQQFVGYGDGLEDMVKKVKRAIILTSKQTRKTYEYQKMLPKEYGGELVEMNFVNWNQSVKRKIKEFGYGTVILYSTEAISNKEIVQNAMGWRVDVVDLRKILLNDICTALNMVGKDGLRPRQRLS